MNNKIHNLTGKEAGLPGLCPTCGADLKTWREMFNERHSHYEQRQGVAYKATFYRRAVISSALIKPQAPKWLELAAMREARNNPQYEIGPHGEGRLRPELRIDEAEYRVGNR